MTQPPGARVGQVEVWRTLMEVHARVLGEIGERLAGQHGLTVSEFDTLVNVPPEGIRHQELADRVILSRSALTRLVDRLCGRGLVTRQRHPTDQRGVEIVLTDAGAELRRVAARTNARAVVTHFGRQLTSAQVAELGALLRTVRDGF